MQDKLIADYHIKSTHRGMIETLEHLKRELYFPKMKVAITKIINNCETCQINKYERNREPLKYSLTETPSKPLEILHIDIYSIHKEVFLTVLDKFSKFGSAYILNSRNSIDLIKSLKHYFSHHGIPKKIVTDNGAEFLSSLFKDFVKAYNIELHTTCAKNSTGNSPVERFHSTLTELIRIIYNQNNKKPISEIVNEALISYNNSIHSATKFAPFELLTGHYTKGEPFPNCIIQKTEHDYLRDHIKNYKELSELVHKRSLIEKEKRINKLNENRKNPPDFESNQEVYELDDRRNKLAGRFIKHKVVKNDKFTVNSNKRKIHKQRIKKKRKFTGPSTISMDNA